MCAITEEIRDCGLTDIDDVVELLHEFIAHAFESVDCARDPTALRRRHRSRLTQAA